MGAVQYELPVSIAPSPSSLAPVLKLVYTSGAPTTQLGYGWSVSGLSTITRCASTVGERPGVLTLRSDDRLCLDGNPLVLQTGEYWGLNAEYKTENETFSKVTASTDPAGVTFFTLKAKDGVVSTYGSDATSRRTSTKSTEVLSWHLDHVQDLLGNFYSIAYSKDESIGDILPSELTYGGNVSIASAAEFKVNFLYENRPDPIDAWIAGIKLSNTQRLSSIKSNTNDGRFLEYRIAYETSSTTARSLISSITRCTSVTDCLDPLTFKYDSGRVIASKPWNENTPPGATETLHSRDCMDLLPVDVNADGKADLLCITHPNANLPSALSSISDGKALKDWTKWGTASGPVVGLSDCLQTTAGDFNGDGYTDFVCVINSSRQDGQSLAQFWISLGSAQGLQPWTKWGEFPIDAPAFGLPTHPCSELTTPDLDGDGRSDLLCVHSHEENSAHGERKTTVVASYALSDGAKFALWDELPELNGAGDLSLASCESISGSQLQAADIDGSGKAAFVCHAKAASTCLYCIQGPKYSTWVTKLSEENVFGSWIKASEEPLNGGIGMDACSFSYEADVNGDGLNDFVCIRSIRDGFEVLVQIANGKGYEPWSKFGTPLKTAQVDVARCGYLQLVDVNHDGRADIFCWENLPNGSRVSVAYSTAVGYVTWSYLTEVISDSDFPKNRCSFALSDFEGHGRSMLACISRNDADPPTMRRMVIDGGTDVLTKISNTHGYSTSVSYSSLGDENVYKKDNDAAYPIQDIVVGGLLASSYSTTDGSGGTRTISLRYAGLKVARDSHRSLGFREATAFDDGTGIETTTTYFQDFPYAGLVRGVETRIAASQVLIGRATNAWGLYVYTKNCEQFYAPSATWVDVTSDSQSASERDTACDLARQSGALVRGRVRVDKLASSQAIAAGTRPSQALNPSYLSFVKESDSQTWDLGGKQLSGVHGTYTFDEFGNVVSVEKLEADGRRTRTDSKLEYDSSRGQFGRVTEVSMLASINGTELKRTTAFQYSFSGLLESEWIERYSESESLKSYEYDALGHVRRVTESSPQGLARTTSQEYDSTGNVSRLVNPLGHIEVFSYDTLFGHKVSRIDPASRTWSWKYDGSGREIGEVNAGGNRQQMRYIVCLPRLSCPEHSTRAVITSRAGAPDSIVFYDSLERQVWVAERAFGKGWNLRGSRYDAAGRVYRDLEVAHAGAAHPYREYKYDDLGRVAEISNEEGVLKTFGFDGLVTSVSDDRGGQETVSTNPRGLPILRSSPNGAEVHVAYDPWGNLLSIALGDHVVVTNLYDVMGKLISSSAVDRGTTTYDYDGFGRIAHQSNSKTEQTYSFEYDQLDRLVERISGSVHASWTYDKQPNAIGLLTSISDNDGNRESYVYEPDGQLQSRTKTIGGEMFTFRYSYNDARLISKTTYPDGFAVDNRYDASGFLQSQRGAGGALLSEAVAISPRGQVSSVVYGNSLKAEYIFSDSGRRLTEIRASKGPRNDSIVGLKYTYDKYGLVHQIDDLYLNSTERFEYDEMRRLVLADPLGGRTQNETFDRLGRPTSTPSVENVDYDPNKFSFAPSNLDSRKISFDEAGRLKKWEGGIIDYGSHGKPILMRREGYKVSLKYDDEYELTSEHIENLGDRTVVGPYTLKPVGDVIHINGLYQERRYADKTLKYNYLAAGSGIYGVVIDQFRRGSRVPERFIRYFHRDRIGSVIAISSEHGDLVEQRRYDAWGNPRDVSQRGVVISSELPIDVGFAGHSGMRDFGLVYAGGRLYSPELGLFTSADPLVPTGGSFFEYHPYGYASFNSLGTIDPAGQLSFGEALGGVIGVFIGGPIGGAIGLALVHEAEHNETLRVAITVCVAVAVTVGTGGSGGTVGAAMLSGMAAGAAAGGTYTALSGGSVSDVLGSAVVGAVVGGVSGAASFGIAQGATYISGTTNSGLLGSTFTVGAQGIAGGVTNEALGGDFKHGFEQAAFFSAVSEAGSALYRGTMQKGRLGPNGERDPDGEPMDFDEYKDGRPHLSDVAREPADGLKGSNEEGVAKFRSGKYKDLPSYRANNWGQAAGLHAGPVEGGGFSTFMSLIPGQNPTAYLHDSWMAQYQSFAGLGFTFENSFVLSTLPAGVVTYSAMAHEIYTIRNQAVWGCRYTTRQLGGGASC
nr:FG-GAP-like repeat-containing protein [Rudaea cellulosilytica]